MKLKLLATFGIILFLALVYWLSQDLKKTSPGEILSDLGRDHISDIYGIEYNSNPPTSGKHFPVWLKKGVYNQVISDGYLIHSLEHGYVVISYNCDVNKTGDKGSKFSIDAKAHEGATESGEAINSGIPLMHMVAPTGGVSFYTPQNLPPQEISLPDLFKSEECKKLVDQLTFLSGIATRIIVVPRPNLDANVALTAWVRILKLNSSGNILSEDQLKQAKEFVESFHNKGPEKTME